MNAYFIDAGEQHEYVYAAPNDPELGSIREDYYAIDIMIAENRGQARADFVAMHNLEFTTPMTIKLLRKGEGFQRGAVDDWSDPLWSFIDPRIFCATCDRLPTRFPVWYTLPDSCPVCENEEIDNER